MRVPFHLKLDLFLSSFLPPLLLRDHLVQNILRFRVLDHVADLYVVVQSGSTLLLNRILVPLVLVYVTYNRHWESLPVVIVFFKLLPIEIGVQRRKIRGLLHRRIHLGKLRLMLKEVVLSRDLLVILRVVGLLKLKILLK